MENLYRESFKLNVTPPFRLDLTVWTLRRRLRNSIDRWDGKHYSRVLAVNGKAFLITVEQLTEIELSVTVQSVQSIEPELSLIKELLQRVLGVHQDLTGFYLLSEKDTLLQALIEPFMGVKPPRFPSIFEALVTSIACQQITLDLGVLLLNRLAENFGLKFTHDSVTHYAFPSAEDLSEIPEKDIKKLGFSYRKAQAIVELSQALVQNKLSFSDKEALSNEKILDYLLAIRGIGRWSAEYVLLRGYGKIDMLPGDDVGAQKNLGLLLHLKERPNYDQVQKLTTKWKPFAGLVYFHLLLKKLDENGFLKKEVK